MLTNGTRHTWKDKGEGGHAQGSQTTAKVPRGSGEPQKRRMCNKGYSKLSECGRERSEICHNHFCPYCIPNMKTFRAELITWARICRPWHVGRRRVFVAAGHDAQDLCTPKKSQDLQPVGSERRAALGGCLEETHEVLQWRNGADLVVSQRTVQEHVAQDQPLEIRNAFQDGAQTGRIHSV